MLFLYRGSNTLDCVCMSACMVVAGALLKCSVWEFGVAGGRGDGWSGGVSDMAAIILKLRYETARSKMKLHWSPQMRVARRWD